MKQHNLMSLLQKDFTTVHVAFRADIKEAEKQGPVPFDSTRQARPRMPRLFTYKADLSDNIKVDDYVVVEGQSGGPMVALVFKVDLTPHIDVDADFDYKWIVQKIDRSKYDERLKREEEFKETMRLVEAEHQRQNLVDKFMEHLPEGSEARQRMQAAIEGLNVTSTNVLENKSE